MSSESYDLVIVGSGWFGLGAARAYIATHPSAKITLLESNPTIGGTWSQHRLYPGLKSNNMLGSYEFPDFPMREDVYGVKKGEHIPGRVLHRYLTDYAREFGVLERCQFGVRVSVVEAVGEGAEEEEEGWVLHVEMMNDGPERKAMRAKKLILATGLTSTPNIPSYPGADTFGKPFFHAKDFCTRASEVLTDSSVPSPPPRKNIVVMGGAKSAYDVAYAIAESGGTVDLIVRPSGNGPVWIAPRYVTPLLRRIDTLLNVRALSWFSPCPWGHEDGFGAVRRFLQGTVLGRVLVRAFWGAMGNDVVVRNGYDENKEVGKLKPWHDVFWIGSGLSILNYEGSLFGMVREGRIRVRVEEVVGLRAGRVVLGNGEEIEAEGVVCSTGWRKESTIEFRGLEGSGGGLGMGYKSEEERARMVGEYDRRVLEMFPILAEQPTLPRRQPSDENKLGVEEPLRYYRFMVPPALLARRNLAFAGMVSSVSTAICATVQSLWIAAYLDGALEREPPAKREEVAEEVMLHTQWGKWRYPCGYGASLPDFVFEGIPYADMLLRDLGVRNHRKGVWVRELVEPYVPADYAGVVDEWREGRAKRD